MSDAVVTVSVAATHRVGAQPRWVPVGESTTATSRSGHSLAADGTSLIEGLQPGIYTVAVDVGSINPGPMTIEGIEVIADETHRDPRLQSIDLRGRQTQVRLDVQFEATERPHIDVLRCRGANPPWFEWQSPHGDRLLVVSSGPIQELLLHARGYRMIHIEDVKDHHHVTLRRGIPLHVVLEGGLPELDPRVQVRVAARIEEPIHVAVVESAGGALGPDGRAELRLKRAGAYAVSLLLVHVDLGVEWLTLCEQRIVVADRGDEVRARFRVEREALERALALIEEQVDRDR